MDFQEIEQFVTEVRNRVNQYLSSGSNEISQEQLAKQAGISGGALSSFRAGNYQGNNENVAKKLMPVLDAIKSRETAALTVKEPEIIETAIMREMWFGLQYASDRNDVIVIYGAPGIGKTITLEKYVKNNPTALFVTASPNIRSGRDIMEELLEAMNKRAEGRNKALEKSIISSLKHSNRMIIIDEAHFLRLDGLETLRRIYDATKCPLVLVGNPKIMEAITEKNKTVTGQFFSRAVRIALDTKVPMDDVKGIVLQNGVNLTDECLQELYKVANMIGALRIMTKLFLFAWTIANKKNQPISLEDILTARKIIISV
ncbi:AAA family ATPase [Propionispora vibrioides]|uniref:DNA transposition protein, AAA+ family ATPase n=1 Tax=Propionispora vibrioides TaxID=112903 RepID=A0A1H8U3V3_9FIRM|nr:AAA family ATPase [Propionispora vibrioides]SEO97736.1 DNA transposition protein, AAA+ family ATPase [Propionispora vibrioides]